MRSRFRVAVARALLEFLRDGIGLAAVAAIGYGAWMAWPPAGFMVGGGLVLAGVLLSARNGVALPTDGES